jgi:hypothetical protein
MAYDKSAEEVRHYCRNPRCGSKLPAPVSNSREAFCTRGCYNSFHLSRCLICEGRIEQPKRGKRLICKKVKCRSALRSNSCLGRYHPSSAAKSISHETDFIGVKEPLTPQRPWRIVAGPELSPSAFRCAVLGGEEAVEAINRTNLKHWRVANAKAEKKTLIERYHPPVNVLGGYKYPGAPVVDLPSKPATSEVRGAKTLFTDDRLDIPDFLRRTDRPPEALAAQFPPPKAAYVRASDRKKENPYGKHCFFEKEGLRAMLPIQELSP